MSSEIHDFHGPYQIHTHPQGDVVFIKNGGIYSYDSDKLREIVTSKISEYNAELMKWNILLDRINNNV